MRDEIEESTKNLRGWIAHVRKGQAKGLLETITENAHRSGAEVLVVKSDMVFGIDHMKTAMYHARKAIDEHRNASESLAMETLLYSSGERQLSSAISKMSVDKSTEEVAVVSLGNVILNPETDWNEMPRITNHIDKTRLMRFGVSSRELETVSTESGIELIFERVAAVDILKK